MRNAHCRAWNMVRKLKDMEKEKLTVQDLEYGEKTEKTWKMRNAHNRTGNMARHT